jgi:Ca2+-binding EF-hand superfamily protein
MKKANVEKLEEIFKGFDEKGTGKIATNDLSKIYIISAKLISSAKISAN